MHNFLCTAVFVTAESAIVSGEWRSSRFLSLPSDSIWPLCLDRVVTFFLFLFMIRSDCPQVLFVLSLDGVTY